MRSAPVLILALVIGCFSSACASASAGVQLAPFVADITPAAGEILCCGLGNRPRQADVKARLFDHPLLAKGLVLQDASGTYVLCAFDWTGICNESHDIVRRKLAEAAGTTPDRVAAQSLHQHTAPSADTTAQRILDQSPGRLITIGNAYFERSVDSVAAAVKDAMTRLKPITHLGTGSAPVDRLASSRRIRLPDGSIGTRQSSTQNPTEQKWPEGKIDGFLRTVSFYDGETPVASVHYYAMHPQAHYGDGLVTWDVPGIARERLQQETGVFQIYFTGCGGDLAMGKYNDGNPANRPHLADRLYEALKQSTDSISERHAATSLRWQSRKLDLQPRRAPEFSEAVCRKIIDDEQADSNERIKAAMVLAFRERIQSGHQIDLSCLSIGPVRMLHLPGETFVEYQLFAQRTAAEGVFVAVAGYGDCGMWYFGDNQAYRDRGGYEQTWSFIEPSEELLKSAIEDLLTEQTE